MEIRGEIGTVSGGLTGQKVVRVASSRRLSPGHWQIGPLSKRVNVYLILTPKVSLKALSPLEAMSTALVLSIRLVQPLVILWVQINAPSAPPRCDRRSLQSKH